NGVHEAFRSAPSTLKIASQKSSGTSGTPCSVTVRLDRRLKVIILNTSYSTTA
ncbi:hypothetical protein TNCV_774911, partial [Trichonephila clavipes]